MTAQAASTVVSLADFRRARIAGGASASSDVQGRNYSPSRISKWGALSEGDSLSIPDACTSDFTVEVAGVLLSCRITVYCKFARSAESPSSLHLVRVFWLDGEEVVGKVVALVYRSAMPLSEGGPIYDCMASWLDAFTEKAPTGKRQLVREAAQAWPMGWGKVQCRIYGAEIKTQELRSGYILEVFAETLRALVRTLHDEIGVAPQDINFTTEARDVADPAYTSAVSSGLWGLVTRLSFPRFELAEGLGEIGTEVGVPHNVYVIPSRHPILSF